MNKNIEDLNNVIADAIQGDAETRKSADKVLAKQQREALDLLAVITAGREEIEELDLINLENDQKKVLSNRMELELNLAIDSVTSLKEIADTTKVTKLSNKLFDCAYRALGELIDIKNELG